MENRINKNFDFSKCQLLFGSRENAYKSWTTCWIHAEKLPRVPHVKLSLLSKILIVGGSSVIHCEDSIKMYHSHPHTIQVYTKDDDMKKRRIKIFETFAGYHDAMFVDSLTPTQIGNSILRKAHSNFFNWFSCSNFYFLWELSRLCFVLVSYFYLQCNVSCLSSLTNFPWKFRTRISNVFHSWLAHFNFKFLISSCDSLNPIHHAMMIVKQWKNANEVRAACNLK